MSPRPALRVRVDPTLRTVCLTLRKDEVDALDQYARAAGVPRAAYLRAILREARPNPIVLLWSRFKEDPGAQPAQRRH